MKVLLISTYELGRQPFGLASPAAWLRRAGLEVAALDLAQAALDEPLVRESGFIAFYLPMHTATRIALRAIARVRTLNPGAHLCAYGLYAPMNEERLRAAGVGTILGGEFEAALVAAAQRVAAGNGKRQPEPLVSLARLDFLVPDRVGLPALEGYARLALPDGSLRTAGYTEATRGCKHRCRHCPIVPVYDGVFRVVQREVVMEDIRRQVAAGAAHITFGDPDFFNGPAHAAELVRALHREFPGVSYDVTIKVEHLLKHADLLPLLRDTGCAFVTSAVEAVDDRVLAFLDKGHTRADFVRLAGVMRDAGLVLAPTFVAFTPWMTLAGYADLLRSIADLGFAEQVAPIQLAVRLLIPAGSRLLELAEVRALVGAFDPEALSFPWHNPDPRIDDLQRRVQALVEEKTLLGESRTAIFHAVCRMVNRLADSETAPLPAVPPAPARATIPYLTEPWYC